MTSQTLAQKVGQFFFPAVFINDTEENIQATERLIKEHNIGGLTFFHSRASAATNYESKNKVVFNDDSYQRIKELIVRYQKCAATPLLISIDAEWGLAMRIEKTPQYPYAITLGALPEEKTNLVFEVGKQIGLDLKTAGIHYNLSPLADINNNPNNPVIGYRSFGEDKDKVAKFSIAYLDGLKEAGILGCLKHFPGHGNTNVDSHLGLPVLTESLEDLLSNELVPFIKAINHGVDSIMIGHLAVPSLNNGKNTSATLSKPIIEDLLRKQLGYDGLVISDALNMHSVSKLYDTKGQLEWEAFNAGNDVLCFTENVAEGIDYILKNATTERIEASYNRILKCKEQVGLLNNTWQTTGTLNFEQTNKLNEEIAQFAITKIVDNTSNINLSSSGKVAKVALYQNTNNTFFENLNAQLSTPEFSYNKESKSNLPQIITELEIFDIIVVALFVPKAKPLNNFEIEDEVFEFLNTLLKTKNVILTLFGNPYALAKIPNLSKAITIIQAYQDFPSFQKIAAEQILSKAKCLGTLPVKIDIQ